MPHETTDRVAHTPGPYIIAPPGGPQGPFYGLVNSAGNVVALQIVGEANANLFKAAPDLLDVCELTLAFHAADTEAFVARYGAGMTTRELCDRIRTAIARAETQPS
jgi:hypothetical protein